jgi:hypothetical protein
VLAIAPSGALTLGVDLVPTAGSWKRLGDEASFTPRFIAVPGTLYLVVERRDEGWRELARVRVPDADRAARIVVETIDPSVEEVPANLLRFSLTFSAAMDEGSAAGRIHLLDEAGAELPGALLEMPPELWDRDRRRLTVLLEPGRIKRGLQPNVLAGAPLLSGHSVTLVVDADIRDAEGSPLLRGASRTYRVGAPIRSRVDPHLWEVTWPDAVSSELVVRFDRPLDRTLVQRYVRAVDDEQRPVPGRAAVDEDARRWVFKPTYATNGIHVSVDARLEDLAGNAVRRVFDRDLTGSANDELDAAAVILSPSTAAVAVRRGDN